MAMAEAGIAGTAALISPTRTLHAYDPAWNRVGRWAGWLCAVAFVVATLAFLADALGLLGSAPPFSATGGGELQDQASFFRGQFSHQRQILWDIAIRTTLFFVGYVALVPFGMALRTLLGRARAQAGLMAQFLIIGGVLGALSQVATLAEINYWHVSWDSTEPQVLLSYATSVGAIDTLGGWLGLAGELLLGAGLVFLGGTLRSAAGFPAWLRPAVYTAAAGLAGLVVIDVAANLGVDGTDIAHNVVSLLLGVILVPAVLIALAWQVSHRSNASAA